MIVKCPQCATGYSIPENLITDKPKKMRCSRCKNVFTLMRRHDKAPSGYEEFTGSQHLPAEFSFLKSSQPDQSPQTSDPAVEPPPTDGETTAEAQFPAAGDAASAVPEEQAPAHPRAGQPAAAAQPPVSAGYYATRRGVAPAQEAWEDETPLELSVYSIPTETRSRGAQAFGKFLFFVFALGVLFFVFVLVRNDFSLSLSKLDAQIGYAFSGAKPEVISEEARRIDVVVSAKTLIKAANGASYLIVTGDVFNKGFTGASRIILRGRLVTAAQETVAEVRAPCGKTVDEETIKMTHKGAMSGHYRTKTGELYNCVISVDGSSAFQIVFDDVPDDYEKSLNVEITAVTARMAE